MRVDAKETWGEIKERWRQTHAQRHIVAAWGLAVLPVYGVPREELERRLTAILFHLGEALIAQGRDQ